MKIQEFIDNYLDFSRETDIIFNLGRTADGIDYDSLIDIIRESCKEVAEDYADEDGEINEVNYRDFDDDLMFTINEKISL